MRPIGLIAAMREECRPLLQLASTRQPCRVGRLRAWRLALNGQECLLVQSGMGQQRAGEAARALLEAGPRALVSFGVAGAVQNELRIGDVVAARGAARLEAGLDSILNLAEFPAPARQAMTQALKARGARLLTGTTLTTRGSQIAPGQILELENPVLEMETAAIAEACAEADLPCLALRGISDNPAEPIPLDLGAVIDESGRLRAGELARAFARQPGILFQVRRLVRNTALAAENTAAALFAALGAGAP